MNAFVPDTNTWLHGKLPLGFAEMAEGEPFLVVIPRRVLSELDERQHEGRGATRKRARQMVMAWRSIMRSGSLRAGAIEARAPDGVMYRLVLDAPAAQGSSADDVIVATAASLVASGLDPTIVTSDAAMQMTARLAGLEVRILSPDELEPDDADSLEQEVAGLKKQLKKLQEPQALMVDVVAQPLWPGGDPTELVRLTQPSNEALDELRRQVQIGMQPPATVGLPSPASRPYLEALPQYARDFMEYLRERARWEATAEAGIEVQILVINRTQYPVGDAVLDLRAPAHVMFKYPPEKPEPPATPGRPKGTTVRSGFSFPRGEFTTGFGDFGSGFPISPPLSLPNDGPKVRAEQRWAEMRLAEPLRPDHEAFAGRLWIGIEPEFEGDDIVVPYTLYANVAGKPTSGEFVVRIRWRDEGWQPPALPTHDDPRLSGITRTDQRAREHAAKD